jgi:hypothetical protein
MFLHNNNFNIYCILKNLNTIIILHTIFVSKLQAFVFIDIPSKINIQPSFIL